MIKKNKNKERIAFKRTHDFWAGFMLSSFILVLSSLFILEFSIEIKTLILAFLAIDLMFLYYLNATSKIIKTSLKTLLFWNKKKRIDMNDYSMAIEYKTLQNMVESKKNLEEALKLMDNLKSDQKISEFVKLINDNKKNNNIWKN